MSTYTIDPQHSSAQFKVRHMMIASVRGEFGKVTGNVAFDPANPSASTVTAEVDVNSITTREPDRDAHLKSGDFFDTAAHPTMNFKSKSVKADGPGNFAVTGDLTIKGVSKEVVFKVEGLADENKDPWGNMRRGAEATAKIRRKDFGLTWNQVLEAGGLMVGDDVEITLDIQIIKAA